MKETKLTAGSFTGDGYKRRMEWNELEQKYEQFKTKTSTLAEVTEDSAGVVAEAIKLVGEELREGYKRIRNSL